MNVTESYRKTKEIMVGTKIQGANLVVTKQSAHGQKKS